MDRNFSFIPILIAIRMEDTIPVVTIPIIKAKAILCFMMQAILNLFFCVAALSVTVVDSWLVKHLPANSGSIGKFVR